MGVIIGGRLGYVFFYKPGDFLDNPLVLFAIQQGGMSFHGGLLGVIGAMYLYARKMQRHFCGYRFCSTPRPDRFVGWAGR